jgi:hypothetical protein
MINILLFALSYSALFAFFCAISADPKAEAMIHVGNPFFGFHVSKGPIPDPDFRLVTPSAAIWTAIFIGLLAFDPGHCSLAPKEYFSIGAILAAGTVIIATKVLFGPIMPVKKSLRLVGEHKFSRPVALVIYDAIRVLPLAVFEKFIWKLVTVSFFVFVVWLLHLDNGNNVIPLAFFLAWALACLGRVSGFFIHLKVPHSIMAVGYVLTLVVIVTVSQLVEGMMKACGAQPDVLPSFGSIVTAIAGLTITQIAIGLLGSIF